MVQWHDNHISVLTQMISFIRHLFNGWACKESTSVQPYHNRFFCFRIQTLCPNIQILAILIHWPVTMWDHNLHQRMILHQHRAHITIGQSIFNTFPWFYLSGHLKAISISILDAMESVCRIHLKSPYLTRLSLNYRFCLTTVKTISHFVFHLSLVILCISYFITILSFFCYRFITSLSPHTVCILVSSCIAARYWEGVIW